MEKNLPGEKNDKGLELNAGENISTNILAKFVDQLDLHDRDPTHMKSWRNYQNIFA